MITELKHIAFTTVAFALTACSSTDEPNVIPSPDDCISFGLPTVNLQATLSDFASNLGTRAVSSWTSIDKFQVWGFCVPNEVGGTLTENKELIRADWNKKSTLFTSEKCADVFYDLTVATDNGFTYYHTGDNINPNSDHYQFKDWNDYAEACYSFIGGYVPDGLGSFDMKKGYLTNQEGQKSYGPKLTFTLAQNGSNNNTPLDYKKQPDALVAATFDLKQGDGHVNMSFFHFMTGIRFKFHNYTSDKTLYIKKVTYSGKFHKNAYFDFTSDEPVMTVDGSYSGTFTLLNRTQSIPSSGADYMMDSEGDIVTLLLLPNPDGTTNNSDNKFVLGSEKEIKIVYSIGDGKDRTFTYGENFTLNYTPKPNTLHTAHFNFVGDEFVVMFQADDKNWVNGSDNNVIIK